MAGADFNDAIEALRHQLRRRRPALSQQEFTAAATSALSAVGDASTWKVWQVDNCGKGEPNQVMQLGHGIPVVRFDNVITGERK